jgi:HAD superfamily hydrolase (TIGR01549 family)
MSIKAVIFDLDGTITEPYFDFDAIREEMGLSRDNGPVWEAMLKMTPQQRQRADEILAFHEQKAVDESTLNPTAKQTLESLRRKKIKIGILTRNKRSNAFAVADRHGLKFDAVLGREDGPVKPDAFGVLELCRIFRIKPTEVLVVGDYLYDLLCARAACSIAVLLANHEKADEFTKHADFTIEKIGQVLEIIEKLNHKRGINEDTC